MTDPLYLFGPTGSGKTSLVRQVAARLNYPVFDVIGHVGGNMIPALPDFSLYGNYVYENNAAAKHKINANAWYLEPGYHTKSR